jgi:hypothetical protein
MHGLLKQPGYRLYSPDSPEAGALLAERGLSPADLDLALAELERSEVPRSAPSSGPTRTGCSAPAAKAGTRTCPRRPRPSSRSYGSRSTSCSGACLKAAPRGSAPTARCQAMSIPLPHVPHRQLSASSEATDNQTTPPRPCAPAAMAPTASERPLMIETHLAARPQEDRRRAARSSLELPLARRGRHKTGRSSRPRAAGRDAVEQRRGHAPTSVGALVGQSKPAGALGRFARNRSASRAQ